MAVRIAGLEADLWDRLQARLGPGQRDRLFPTVVVSGYGGPRLTPDVRVRLTVAE